MDPAFSSTRQAGAFALLLLVILLGPWLVGKWALPPREQIYSSIPWRKGSFPYFYRQIFEEKSNVDIAFIGSSHMSNDIDTPYVQQQLSEKLGRPATVISLCWVNRGFDTYYFIAKDLLEHRKVHLLVFYDDHALNEPHLSSWRWVRFGDNSADLTGLPLSFRIKYYYGSILGLPRNLLNCLRSNLETAGPDQFFSYYSHAFFPSDYLGAFTSQVAYNRRPDLFRLYSPQTRATPADVCVYSPETRNQFHFSDSPAPPLQAYFARKFLALTEQDHTRLLCLNLPILSDRYAQTIPEGRLWKDCFEANAALVGIAPARLFEGLDDEQMGQLYQDDEHFNQNGQAYFTRLVTPDLIKLYEQADF
jgi:hypothetical protein